MTSQVPFANAMEYVQYVENRLGWAVPSKTAEIRRKALIIEAARVKRKIESAPDLYTWASLHTTVEWLYGKHRTSTPAAALAYVREALKQTWRPATPKPADIAVAIEAAITQEQSTRLEGWEGWIRRLTRAAGDGRQDVHSEWLKERNEK